MTHDDQRWMRFEGRGLSQCNPLDLMDKGGKRVEPISVEGLEMVGIACLTREWVIYREDRE